MSTFYTNSFYYLFHGLPLCQSLYPTFSHLDSLHLVAHVTLIGPLPSDELEEMANPLPPPKRNTRFPMLYHSFGLLLALLVLAHSLIPG